MRNNFFVFYEFLITDPYARKRSKVGRIAMSGESIAGF